MSAFPLSQLPREPLVMEADGTLRLLAAGEELWSPIEEPVAFQIEARTLLVPGRPGGKFNANASLLSGQAVFGPVLLVLHETP